MVEGFNQRARRQEDIFAWAICNVVNNLWAKKALRPQQILGRKIGSGGNEKTGRAYEEGTPEFEEFLKNFPPEAVKDFLKNSKSRNGNHRKPDSGSRSQHQAV